MRERSGRRPSVTPRTLRISTLPLADTVDHVRSSLLNPQAQNAEQQPPVIGAAFARLYLFVAVSAGGTSGAADRGESGGVTHQPMRAKTVVAIFLMGASCAYLATAFIITMAFREIMPLEMNPRPFCSAWNIPIG